MGDNDRHLQEPGHELHLEHEDPTIRYLHRVIRYAIRVLAVLMAGTQRVASGALLVELDQRVLRAGLAAAEARVALAKLKQAEAGRELDRTLELYDRTLLSEHEKQQAQIDAAAADLPARIVAVISNRAGVYGLERAARAGIITRVLDHGRYPDRDSFDVDLAELIDSYEPHLVVLAGFMRILTEPFVEHFAGRMINIHPSLLPAFQVDLSRTQFAHRCRLRRGDAEPGDRGRRTAGRSDAGQEGRRAEAARSRGLARSRGRRRREHLPGCDRRVAGSARGEAGPSETRG